jgi:addiction module RelE/StbE family toxin
VEYQITISPKAFRDLEEIRNHIATDNPVAAEKFVQKLLEEAYTLRNLPLRGLLIKGKREARFLVYKSYLIVYRLKKDRARIRVLRYWHSARDPVGLRV